MSGVAPTPRKQQYALPRFLRWLLFLFTILLPNPNTAQTLPFTFLTDSLAGQISPQPALRLGSDKIANTFLFRGEFAGIFSVPLGTLLLRTQYRGSTIRSGAANARNTTNASRDDADALMRYLAPIDSTLSFIMLNNFLLSQDSRSIGLNRLLQVGANAGLEWKPRTGFAQMFETVRLSALFGGEYNEQLSVADRGWTLMGAGSAQNLRLDDYLLSLDGGGFLTNLSNTRTNQQWNARLSVFKTFEAPSAQQNSSQSPSQLEFSAQYTTLQRDFYTTFQQQLPQGLTNTLALERRLERLLRINTRFATSLGNGIDADLAGFIENWAVRREYREPIERVSLTAAQRDVDQLRFSLNATVRASVRLAGFAETNNSAGIIVDNREETNTIRERFPLVDSELQILRNAERQRDNVGLRTTLWWQTAWNLASGDSVRVDYSTSLLRYDTPSPLNNDDRDELATNVSAAYTHVFSHFLLGTILADVRLAHLVFIKAQRSAQNNWNRVFRLVPSVLVNTGAVVLRPQFEVLANYTSFDFEDLLGTAQSFSLRQVAYRDSITIHLNSNTLLESRMIFRYFERGEFRWREFSETPRDRNIEAFARLLCIASSESFFGEGAGTLVRKARYGAGGRIYILSQSPSGLGFVRVNEFLNQAIAPETLIDIEFRSGTLLRCNGWLEFQSDRTSLLRIVPNFLFSVAMQL
ncbi:MAG: hypothetical protein EAZ92_04700 [Candidatus Kapaibacterium sp.]|nr:MAG: hypothetical protein EAZ92_04700 [Candidatus Kapabacteria bacterium]